MEPPDEPVPFMKSASCEHFIKSSSTEEPSKTEEKETKSRKKSSKGSIKVNELKEGGNHSSPAVFGVGKSEEQKKRRNYSTLRVYSISNCSSKERLRKKIAQGKADDSVRIDWDAIMASN